MDGFEIKNIGGIQLFSLIEDGVEYTQTKEMFKELSPKIWITEQMLVDKGFKRSKTHKHVFCKNKLCVKANFIWGTHELFFARPTSNLYSRDVEIKTMIQLDKLIEAFNLL